MEPVSISEKIYEQLTTKGATDQEIITVSICLIEKAKNQILYPEVEGEDETIDLFEDGDIADDEFIEDDLTEPPIPPAPPTPEEVNDDKETVPRNRGRPKKRP